MVKTLVPPIWLAKKLSILRRKISNDCRSCPLLKFEFTCTGFKKTFRDAYGNIDPEPCPWLIVSFGKVGMRIFRELKLFNGLGDCRICELKNFCLASCEGFKLMYKLAYGLSKVLIRRNSA